MPHANSLASADLSAPAGFRPAIHADCAGVHRRMGLTATRDQAHRLQELVQRDELSAQSKTNFQGDSSARRSTKQCANDNMMNEPQPPRHAPGAALSLRDIDRIIARAQASGDLQHIETEQTTIPTPVGDFLVRWVSSLQHKNSLTKPAMNPAARDFNPFLAPEPALVISRLAPDHVCLLNKFPVIDRHLLIITRQFEAQTAPLGPGDFQALATVLEDLGGLGFYNGGTEAGASQGHKHLQWIPESRQSSNFIALTQALEHHADCTQGTYRHPALPFRHVFIRLTGASNALATPLADTLHAAYLDACRHVAIDAGAAALAPYNLLVDRRWMLLVPRSRESFEGISVNALGFAASLFVRERGQLARIRETGPLALLRAVACPA